MKRIVVLRPKAEQQLEDMAAWWAANRSQEQAERWYRGFVRALKSLSQDPTCCSLALENREFPFEVRELRYGLGSKPSHRALFTVSSDRVYVFLIRHLAQQNITPGDVSS